MIGKKLFSRMFTDAVLYKTHPKFVMVFPFFGIIRFDRKKSN